MYALLLAALGVMPAADAVGHVMPAADAVGHKEMQVMSRCQLFDRFCFRDGELPLSPEKPLI